LRIPPFARYQRLLSSLGLMLSGAIIGSAIYMSIHQHTYNQLYVQMHKYLEENRDLLDDIENLNKTKNKQALINVVNVHLLPKNQNELISEDIQKEIEGDVKSELKLVIGQKAAFVRDSQPLYERIITQRTYILHDKKYIVEVKSIVLIQTELTVWITAQEKRT
jgi:guanylate kinase